MQNSQTAMPWQARGDFARQEVPAGQVEFRRLRTLPEIAGIHHLRAEIHLPTSAVADPGFAFREKKETSRGSSAPLPGTAPSSGP